MAVADALVTRLTGVERQVLDAWTAKFEASWHADRLAQVLQSPPEELKSHPQIYLTELVKIDLRKHWQTGQLRRVEGYLVEHPELGTLETVSIELLYAEYLARKTAGRGGAFEDLSERFPRKAASLRELIGRVDGEADLSPPVAVSPQPVAAPPKKEKDEDGLKFGRFRVEKEIGSDETGTTYEARDSIYDRRALVKVLRFEGRAAAERTERFLRDARAAAKLQNEHIGEVYEAGRHNGAPFIVTAVHSGRPLANFINVEHPFTVSKAGIIARQLALALHDAHSIGAVHGDINPKNITIDRNRKPVLVNFGLAERIDIGDERVILGTAAYVAPELITSNTGPNPATDQYSLGIVLFEMLTGRLPMEGSDEAILAKKQTEEVPPPSSLRADIDPRMDDIVAHMTSRYVEDRFADMQHVADAMQSLLTDGDAPQTDKSDADHPVMTVAARPESNSVAPESASTGSALDVDAAYAVEQRERVAAFIQNGNYDAAHELLLEMSKQTKPALRESVDWARAQLRTLKDQHQDAVEQVRILVTTADDFIARHDYDQALQILEGVPPGLATTGVKKLRKEARRKLERIDEVGEKLDAARGKGHSEEVQRLARELESLRPNDPRLRQLRRDRQLQKDRRQEAPKMSSAAAAGLVAGVLLVMVLIIVGIFLLRGPTTGRVSVRVNDQRLEVFIDGEPISLTGDGWEAELEPAAHSISVRIGDRDLNIGTPTEIKHEDGTIDKHELTIALNGVPMSDGRFDVARGVPILLQIEYRMTTQEPKKPDPPPQVAGNDPEKKKPEPDPKPEPKPEPKKNEPPADPAPQFTKLFVLRGHTAPVRGVAWNRDGSRIVTGSLDGRVMIWNSADGSRVRTMRRNAGKIFDVDYSPNSNRVASASEDNTGHVWNVDTGRLVGRLRGHTSDIFCVRYSPDGKRIVLSGHIHGILICSTATNAKEFNIPMAHPDSIPAVAFSPDNKFIATGSDDRSIKLWDVSTKKATRIFTGHIRSVRRLAFTPDGTKLVSIGFDRTAIVWNVETGEIIHKLQGHTARGWTVAVSPDGKWIATGGADSTILIWNTETGKQAGRLTDHTRTVCAVAFSRDGRYLASSSADQTTIVWQVDTK